MIKIIKKFLAASILTLPLLSQAQLVQPDPHHQVFSQNASSFLHIAMYGKHSTDILIKKMFPLSIDNDKLSMEFIIPIHLLNNEDKRIQLEMIIRKYTLRHEKYKINRVNQFRTLKELEADIIKLNKTK